MYFGLFYVDVFVFKTEDKVARKEKALTNKVGLCDLMVWLIWIDHIMFINMINRLEYMINW